MIDTHAHYDDAQFDVDREALLQQMYEGGVETVVNISASVESLERTVELTKAFPFVYGTIGIHPDEVGKLDESVFCKMEELLQEEKIVAVGEIGLDYHWNIEEKETQRYWFIRQLDLAKKYRLPVVIHSRDAAADTMEVLRKHGRNQKIVVHCYSYEKEMAKEYVNMGYYIGVGGVLTFKNGRKLKEVVDEIPLERILIETDAPYLAPEPYRGRRNHSLYLRYVIEKIAEQKGVSPEEVERITTQNAKEFYGM